MAQIAYLECARCRHRVSAETVQSVCPVDAGPLLVRYDLAVLKQTARRERPAELAAAAGVSLGMWRYADLLPAAEPVTLGEGWTPLLRSRRYDGLLVKEEGANPAGTSEARGMSMAVTMARSYGLRQLVTGSTGDVVGALAAYSAAAQIQAHVFLPKDGPLANYLETVLYGADVQVADGTSLDCGRMASDAVRKQKEQAQKDGGLLTGDAWFDVSTLQEPYRVEGMKTMGYELVEQMGWVFPDAVIYPAGCAAALIGLWKAFEEMDQLEWVTGRRPRLYAAQASGGTSVETAYGDAIVLETVQKSGGRMVESSEEEMMASLRDWASEEGLFLCPAGAAAAAGYTKLLASGEIKAGERVVLFNTSAGLKYADTVARALRLRPRSLPTSLPVGGIITPV